MPRTLRIGDVLLYTKQEKTYCIGNTQNESMILCIKQVSGGYNLLNISFKGSHQTGTEVLSDQYKEYVLRYPTNDALSILRDFVNPY